MATNEGPNNIQRDPTVAFDDVPAVQRDGLGHTRNYDFPPDGDLQHQGTDERAVAQAKMIFTQDEILRVRRRLRDVER